MQNNKELCNSCRFFISSSDFMGQCYRYPEAINKSPSGWCGEYVLDVESLPLEVMVQMMTEPVVLSEPKKGRGRPRKS